jgi:hypothetical protein
MLVTPGYLWQIPIFKIDSWTSLYSLAVEGAENTDSNSSLIVV